VPLFPAAKDANDTNYYVCFAMLEQQNGKLIVAAGRRHKDVGSCVYAVLVMTMLQFVVMQLHILFQRLCMQAVREIKSISI